MKEQKRDQEINPAVTIYSLDEDDVIAAFKHLLVALDATIPNGRYDAWSKDRNRDCDDDGTILDVRVTHPVRAQPTPPGTVPRSRLDFSELAHAYATLGEHVKQKKMKVRKDLSNVLRDEIEGWNTITTDVQLAIIVWICKERQKHGVSAAPGD